MILLDLYLVVIVVKNGRVALGGFGPSFETTSEQVIGTEACFSIQKFGWVERNDGTIGDTTLLPIHLTFVELTLGKFTDGVGVLLASVLRFRTNYCFGGCAGI